MEVVLSDGGFGSCNMFGQATSSHHHNQFISRGQGVLLPPWIQFAPLPLGFLAHHSIANNAVCTCPRPPLSEILK